MLPSPDGIGHFINARPNLRLHIVTSGPPDGEPIIMLHGFPEFWWSWRNQLRFLDEHGFRAIAVDLRGFNHSDKPKEGYDPPTLAGDLVGLLDELGYRQATFMGSDYGGFLAYVLALLHPERVKRLIILNALQPARLPSGRRTGKLIMHALTLLARFGHHVGGPLLAIANQRLGIGVAMKFLAYNRKAIPRSVRLAYKRAYARGAKTATAYVPAASAWLTNHLPADLVIPHPVLILWSANDRTGPVSWLGKIPETLPNAKLIVVPNAGHWLQQEQPDAVNAAILEFLKTPVTLMQP